MRFPLKSVVADGFVTLMPKLTGVNLVKVKRVILETCGAGIEPNSSVSGAVAANHGLHAIELFSTPAPSDGSQPRCRHSAQQPGR